MQATGFFQGNVQRPTSLFPYLKKSKKGNTQFTRGVMVDTKPITPPSSARQIYGKVTAKTFHTLFRKGTGIRKQDYKRFSKI